MSNQQFYRTSPTSKPNRPSEIQTQFKFMNTFNNKNLQKIMQLENKSKFFEGQISPLLTQNHTLKAQLTEMRKLMQSSTQMLRNLLPVPSSPQRKLALQLANVEGVSELIKQDWLKMKQQLHFCYEELKNNSIRIEQLLHKLSQTISNHKTEVQFLKNEYEANKLRIQQEKDTIISHLKTTIGELKQEVKQKTVLLSYKERQLSDIHSRHQTEINQLKDTVKAKQRKISNLHEEINANIREHQANKKLIIQHHQQLAAEKQKELRDSYETVIKMREEQASKNIKELVAYAQSLQEKITAKQTQILQLYEINNKYIAEKEQLTEQQRALRQELKATKQQSYKFSQEIAQKLQVIDGLQKQIAQGKKHQGNLIENLRISNSRIQTMQNQKQQMEKIHETQLQAKNKELKQKQEEISRIMSENGSNSRMISLLQAQIQSKIKQIQDALNFQDVCKQLQKQIEHYIQKQNGHAKQIQEFHNKLLEKQKSIQSLEAEKKLISEKMQEAFEIKLREMTEQWKNKQKQIQQQHRDYLEQIKSEQARKDRQYGQHVQSLQNQFSKKIVELERAVENSQKQSRKLQSQLCELETNYRNEIKKSEDGHIQQMQEMYKKYNEEMETMKNLIVAKEYEFENTLKNKQKQHKQMLEKRKKEYDTKLQALQKNIENLKSNTGISDVQNKYKSILQKLRKETDQQIQLVRKQKVRELDALKQDYQKILKQDQAKFNLEKKETHQKHERQIQQIQSRLNEKLNLLSAKLEKNILLLTQQLSSEKQAHHLLKITTGEQIKNLTGTILENKNQLQRKDLQIEQLQFAIGQKIKEMEKIDELVAEKLKKKREQYEYVMQSVKSQCDKMISKSTAECSKKIKDVETERLKFTTNLYNDFKQMKARYEGQVNSLQRKYDELEKLFIQRPSRQEDVKKISELMLMKQKMDIEVKQFQKKMVSANQIVKYLNLQLENYKDMYDIFGSDGIDPGLAQKKREQFENYIRSNLIQLIAEPKNKREEDRSKVGQIRRLMKQRQWRIKTQSDMSRQTVFNQSSIQMMNKVDEEDEGSNDEHQVLEYKKGRYVRVSQKKKKVNRSQSYNEKLGESTKQFRLMSRIQGNTKNPTRELRNNAETFLSLIHKSQKPVEERKRNSEYGKMSTKRRTQSTMEKLEANEREGERRYQLKDKIITISN